MSRVNGLKLCIALVVVVVVMGKGVEGYGPCTGLSDCPPGPILVQFEGLDCTGNYNITSYGEIPDTLCVEFGGKSVSVEADGASMTSGTFDYPGCSTTGSLASYIVVKSFFGACGMAPDMSGSNLKKRGLLSQVELVGEDFSKVGQYLMEQKEFTENGQISELAFLGSSSKKREDVIPIRGTVYLADISQFASFRGQRRLAPTGPQNIDIKYVPQADCPSLESCHNTNSTDRPLYLSASYTDDTCSSISSIFAIEGGDWTNGRCFYSPPYTSFTDVSPSSSFTPAVLSANDGLFMSSYCKDAHAHEQAFFTESSCSTRFSSITTRRLCNSATQQTIECSATPPLAQTSSSSSLSSSLLSSLLFSLLLSFLL